MAASSSSTCPSSQGQESGSGTETPVCDPCSISSNCESDLGSGCEEEVLSLLDKLKSPTPADIARLRKIKTNDPTRGKRKCRGTLASLTHYVNHLSCSNTITDDVYFK